jgi:hypothetical protein
MVQNPVTHKSLLSMRRLVWLLALMGAAAIGLGVLCWLSLDSFAKTALMARGLAFELSSVDWAGGDEASVRLTAKNTGQATAYLSEIHFNLYAQGRYAGTNQEAMVDAHLEPSGTKAFQFEVGISSGRIAEINAQAAQGLLEWRVVGRAMLRVGSEQVGLPLRAVLRSVP